MPITRNVFNGSKNNLHYPPSGYELMGRGMARQSVAFILGREPQKNGSPD